MYIREKELTPPSLEGGGSIDTTTMRNTRLRTFAAKSLITISEMTGTGQYDPAVYVQMIAMLQVNQLVSLTFPDTFVMAFRGWLDSFKPQTLKEGDFPLGEFKIIPSNIVSTVASGGFTNPNSAAEALPIFSGGISAGVIGR